MKTYSYYFNGLIFISEVNIPELEPCNDIPESAQGIIVNVRYGNTPRDIVHPVYKTEVMQASEKEVLIFIENTAWYYIKKDELVIEPLAGAEEKSVRLYIFSIVLGALLHLNNILCLHASSIQVGDNAILVGGYSGAGKSTLALGLHRKGYQVLNDDISSVGFDKDGSAFVYSGVLHLKLWNRTLERYGYDTEDFSKLREELEKYSYPLPRDRAAYHTPVKAIFLLGESQEPTTVKEIDGLEKFAAIRRNTYRYKLLQHLKKTDRHFLSAGNLIGKVPIFKVNRNTDITPADFAAFMEEQFVKL